MKKIYKLLLAITFALSITLSGFSQPYSTDFTSDRQLQDWYFKNNTYPQTDEESGWSNGGSKTGYVGPRPGQGFTALINFFFDALISPTPLGAVTDAFATYNYGYASVGYTEQDYDDAQISKWLISPLLHNLKNGDKIQFSTRAKTIDPSDRIAALIAQDPNGLTDCNRPNRLEVRLSLGGFSNETPDVGDTANSFGTFDRLLLTINPDLTTSGYPSNWQQYTITISGLPDGQAFKGRIGFWYHFDHGGYNYCRNRCSLPAPVANASTAIDVAGSDPATKLLKYVKYGKKAEKFIGKAGEAASVISLASSIACSINEATSGSQNGKNGSFIGLTDFSYQPSPDIYLAGRVKEDGSSYVYYGGVGAWNWTEMGYTGTASCNSSPTLRSSEFYVLKNESDQPITVFPRMEPGSKPWNFILEGTGIPVTIPGKSSYVFHISIKDSLSPGTETGIFTLRKNIAGGDILFGVNMRYTIKSAGPPIARCIGYSINAPITSAGYAVIKNPKSFDNGSALGCGETNGITFGLARNWWEPTEDSLTFGCNSPDQTTVYLKVKQVGNNSGEYATCPITVKVTSDIIPQLENNHTQTYYLGASQKEMPVTDVTKPAVVAALCPVTVTPYVFTQTDFFNQQFFSPTSLGVGTYKIQWSADSRSRSGSSTSSLLVKDTIRPRAWCRQDTVYIVIP
jgi:hypothetical protein